jgi:FMN phosphatase YigB (HAD superfamily)
VIRAVLLDIDDTLLSFQGCVRQTMREGFPLFGLPAYTEDMLPVFDQVSGGLWRQIELGQITLPELEQVRWSRVFAALGFKSKDSQLGLRFEEYFRKQLYVSAIPVPGAGELLAYLAPRYVLCAASNGPSGQQMNRLRVAGMLPSFAHVFISEDIGAQKPSREFFDACFSELRASDCPGLAPAEVMVVGDSLTSDMAGGAAYGMRTCWYHPAPADGERPAGVDHVVASLRDVERVL